MKITVQASKAVKPAYGGGVAPAADVVPLTVFDKATFDMCISVIYAFRAPASPPNAVLEERLARALAEYREWAGRLGVDADGDRAILLNDAGARFVEATADVALDSVMPLRPTPEALNLHPSGDGAEELLLVQVTRFACGSLVVGTTARHVVADGRAATNFFLAWSQATHGSAIRPAPAHDRASLFAPRDPPRVEFEHSGVEFKHPDGKKADNSHACDADDEVVVHKVHFSREFISRLKSEASAGSTLQCVVAHLWRCVTKARGLGDGEAAAASATSVHIAVDGRARMTSPSVPEGYTGNVVLWARPTTTARELVTRPLRHAVEVISREVARINDGYFKSFIDFASSGAVEEERLVPTADAAKTVLSPDIDVDSWLRIPFHELDFGGGRPFFAMPSYLPVEGSIIVVPSFTWDGSVDAYVPLFSRDMDRFTSCCYSPAVVADARL